MPLKLDIKRQLVQRTDRVKGVDLHPTEPWLLANLYNGNVYIWNYSDQSLVKSFEVTELPVRSAKFVARKQWVITASDDLMVRIYNYNTMDKVKAFEAHTDYIRCIAVHPTLPYILTSSDDMLIKLWDWDKGFACVQVFEGHSHYVMQVSFNPKDTNTFASASLDRSIKVWSLGQPTPNFTLEGHEKGVNCVDYFTGGDRPFLISGGDDKLVKVWDYQTKACVQTLEGHTHNIVACMFHPELPIIVTGSEDGTVKVWHSTTYRLENTLDYRMERVWALGYMKGSNNIAIGYDEGAVLIKVGRDDPVASMDSSGKVIWARHNEIQTVNIKALGAEYEWTDGERLPLVVKDLGSCDLYPQSLLHNPNGRFVVVCGDGEYIVYTALAWRNKSFGPGAEFVWGSDSNDYAIKESGNRIKIYKNFTEKQTLKLDFNAESIYGGPLIGARTADFIVFYDWDGRIVRRIDVAVKSLHWSETGDLALISDQSFYVLKYNAEAVTEHFDSGKDTDDDGIEDAFELLNEVSERVKTGVWVGDCFIYTNAAWRLNYCVGGEVTTLYHLDRPMYLLGYLAAQNRVFLIDREFNIISYTLLLSMIEFKTLVMRDDVDAALALLPTIPKDQLNNLAKFLETRGLLKEALDIATDQDFRFDLAIQLSDLETAKAIAEVLDSESKWKQLGELAMASGQLLLAQQCLARAQDFSGLLLLHTSLGQRRELEALASQAQAVGKHNVAFLALFMLGKLEQCVDLLVDTNRLPEAAFFARTYLPSHMSKIVALWKADLFKQNPKASESLADPAEYPNLFPDLELALKAEQLSTAHRSKVLPASLYPQFEGAQLANLIEEVRHLALGDVQNGDVAAEVDGPDEAAEEEEQEEEVEVEVEEEEEEDEEEEAWGAPPAASAPSSTVTPAASTPPPAAPPAPPLLSPQPADDEDEDEQEDEEQAAEAAAAAALEEALADDELFGDTGGEGEQFGDAAEEMDDDWGLDEDDEEDKKD